MAQSKYSLVSDFPSTHGDFSFSVNVDHFGFFTIFWRPGRLVATALKPVAVLPQVRGDVTSKCGSSEGKDGGFRILL